MKIRMLTGISGPDIDIAPKAETDRFTREEALRLMLTSQAEPAEDEAADALASVQELVASIAGAAVNTSALEGAGPVMTPLLTRLAEPADDEAADALASVQELVASVAGAEVNASASEEEGPVMTPPADSPPVAAPAPAPSRAKSRRKR